MARMCEKKKVKFLFETQGRSQLRRMEKNYYNELPKKYVNCER